jgi:hypothetical protein
LDFVKGFQLAQIREVIQHLNLHALMLLQDVNVGYVLLSLQLVADHLLRVDVQGWDTVVVWGYVYRLERADFLEDFQGTLEEVDEANGLSLLAFEIHYLDQEFCAQIGLV